MTEQQAIEMIKYASAFNRDNSPLTIALNVAIEVLEKQIPMKPKISSFGVMRCPKCLGKVGERVSDISYQNCSDYCPNCGQRINWGG